MSEMQNFEWSSAEKKIARTVFDAALAEELAEILTKFKRMAATATTPDQMWEVEVYLTQQRREINAKYDYRYTQLLLVFSCLLLEARIKESDLQGLADDKLETIRRGARL